ncbi:glutamate--tRNA ligase, putative [Plasmodium ovale wallikeri]|uniref:Glutamate--tRNA ligase, putative n=1 Tax=Plasmodium ovale wallikeri TaxID=864142 RepID=A0A1A8Z2C9_PLAOA|nr:glutamate--tRNA ligase, putative [Plasmodium ovale wallikeri]
MRLGVVARICPLGASIAVNVRCLTESGRIRLLYQAYEYHPLHLLFREKSWLGKNCTGGIWGTQRTQEKRATMHTARTHGRLSFILSHSKSNICQRKNACTLKKPGGEKEESLVVEPRLRFAPSPTGFLHVGGCRTFIYNYILSKQMNGSVILRMEDTDIKRNTTESMNEIMKDLKWLNLDWDEGPDKGGAYGPYKQSEKGELYKKIADELVERGKAYLCFCTKEQLKEKKEKAKVSRKKYLYDRTCRYLNEEVIQRCLQEQKQYTIRFKSPIDRKIILKDILKNNIEDVVKEDFIILRSNHLPTYNFAASVDDHLMKISFVIRVLESLNADIPLYAHIPVITNVEKKKISKRNHEYLIRNLRYNFPSPIFSHPIHGRRDLNPVAWLIIWLLWDGEASQRIVFDIKKLKWMNKKYMLDQDMNTYITEAEEYLIDNDILTKGNRDFLELCIRVFKNDIHNYKELKECIINVISYDYMGNNLDINDTGLKDVSFLLCKWFNKNKNDDNFESLMETNFDLLIKYIKEKTNLLKREIFLKIRVLLTFHIKGIPFIPLIRIWALAKKSNIRNYVSLERRLQYLKEAFPPS